MMICRDDRHCPLCSDDCEAYIEVVSASIFDQIKWERDVALEQLNELGLSFGEKPRHGQWAMSSDIPDTIICSNCHEAFDVWKADINRFHFCPNCGCNMTNRSL